MRRQLRQRVQRRVPIRTLATVQRVAMQPCLAGEAGVSFAVLSKDKTNTGGYVGNVHHGISGSISRYAGQANLHTAIGRHGAIRRAMSKTPDQRREILRQFIKERDLQIATWAKQAGVDKNSIYNFLNEHSKSLSATTYAKLARVAKVPAWKLSGDPPELPSPTVVMVSGEVQAGVFKEAVEWEPEERYPVDVPVPVRFQGRARALCVAGESMNQEFRPGSIVIWVQMLDYRPPQEGDHVVVYSYRDDDTIEATLKQYRHDANGKPWLWPQSDHPDYQVPLDTDNPPDNVTGIEIVGIVIGDYRPRHH